MQRRSCDPLVRTEDARKLEKGAHGFWKACGSRILGVAPLSGRLVERWKGASVTEDRVSARRTRSWPR